MKEPGSPRRTVYVETTIISYMTSRPSRDIIVLARQELTRQWWEMERTRYRICISSQVVEEARIGDPSAARKRLALLAGLESLTPTPRIDEVSRSIRSALKIPTKSVGDAIHVAFAVCYELDYLLTWNCAHLANADNLRLLTDFCRREGLWLPVVCTPEEMIGERREA